MHSRDVRLCRGIGNLLRGARECESSGAVSAVSARKRQCRSAVLATVSVSRRTTEPRLEVERVVDAFGLDAADPIAEHVRLPIDRKPTARAAHVEVEVCRAPGRRADPAAS